jgi:hypothetical protein
MTREHQILAIRLANYISDRSAVAAHVNREFGTRYSVADIGKMLAAPVRKPTDSQPRQRSKYADDPVAMHRPISTGSNDPLAVATNAYLEKYADKIRKSLAA